MRNRPQLHGACCSPISHRGAHASVLPLPSPSHRGNAHARQRGRLGRPGGDRVRLHITGRRIDRIRRTARADRHRARHAHHDGAGDDTHHDTDHERSPGRNGPAHRSDLRERKHSTRRPPRDASTRALLGRRRCTSATTPSTSAATRAATTPEPNEVWVSERALTTPARLTYVTRARIGSQRASALGSRRRAHGGRRGRARRPRGEPVGRLREGGRLRRVGAVSGRDGRERDHLLELPRPVAEPGASRAA